MAAQRRPQEGLVWCAPVPSGLGGCYRDSREAAASPGCEERILTCAAWCHFIAGDGRRCLAWNIAVYVGAYRGSEEESDFAPFQGCSEAGYRATGERAYST